MPDPFGVVHRFNTRSPLTGAPRWSHLNSYETGYIDGRTVRRPRCSSAEYLRGYRYGRRVQADPEERFYNLFDNDLGDIDDNDDEDTITYYGEPRRGRSYGIGHGGV